MKKVILKTVFVLLAIVILFAFNACMIQDENGNSRLDILSTGLLVVLAVVTLVVFIRSRSRANSGSYAASMYTGPKVNCKFCGASIDADSIFCKYCGAKAV